MGSFRGKHEHKISETGRISVPSKFREILKGKYESDHLVLISMGDHLRVYPVAEWEKQEERWEEENDPEFNEFLRRLYAMMDECSIDKNGRIVIGQDVRRENGLTGDCFFTGFRNRMEIWSRDAWNSVNSEERKDELFAKFANKF
ncbi:division/cell wall cluster transcriptional repressor MraZ [Limisalsivibrio acetivorans]|uniref:division/cell wall cluster transcriptional repressor MraZ n=1 Tax=Limisalsivibrio acetivorans TaxID=1304888 RepID=UPI0003B57DE0|nr:protein MraZ [Limisalsivibrio acetivorans]